MPLPILDQAHMHPAIRSKVAGHEQTFVQEVMAAVGGNEVVMVGTLSPRRPARRWMPSTSSTSIWS